MGDLMEIHCGIHSGKIACITGMTRCMYKFKAEDGRQFSCTKYNAIWTNENPAQVRRDFGQMRRNFFQGHVPIAIVER